MEEEGVLPCDDVGHPIPVISHGPKPAPSADVVGVGSEVQFGGLAMRGLGGA